jgi:opacity protein-like surface antigen
MHTVRPLLVALFVCTTAAAHAQPPQQPTPASDAASKDGRTQYPAFMANSFFTFSVGAIGYLFGERQLKPGFRVEDIDKPRLSVRVDLFGHRFSKYLSMQATYLRPARFIVYRNINGTQETRQVSNAYGGITFALSLPFNDRVAGYFEGGGGVTSRSGVTFNGKVALDAAHYTSGMLGAGLDIKATPNIDVILAASYLPGRRSFEQPSTRMYTGGLRYHMRPVPDSKVEENRTAGYAFPANMIRGGVTTNSLSYGVNDLFSKKIPIFWGGHVLTRYGATFDYERNVFHTKKIFAFDLGASASFWRSDLNGESFRTLSAYPLFRFFMLRSEPADVYFNYSLAGPTFISESIIDGQETGARFTFQDFMGIGTLLGKNRHLNVELGIKHFSNGNLFPTNASVKIPLTFSVGYAF